MSTPERKTTEETLTNMQGSTKGNSKSSISAMPRTAGPMPKNTRIVGGLGNAHHE